MNKELVFTDQLTVSEHKMNIGIFIKFVNYAIDIREI